MDNGEVSAEFAQHLRLIENRPGETVGTYTAHARTFTRYLPMCTPACRWPR